MRGLSALVTIALLLFAVTAIGQGMQPSDRVLIRKLPLSAFPQIPAEFRKKLEDKGCSIPQKGAGKATRKSEDPMNVISGSFARKGQTDWAALCDTGDQSSIVVFWGKPTACPSEIAMAKDSEFLEGFEYQSFRSWTFDRAIRPATPALMMDLLKESEAGGGQWSTKPPDYSSLNHAGIQENVGSYFVHVHYCSSGKWYRLDYTGE